MYIKCKPAVTIETAEYNVSFSSSDISYLMATIEHDLIAGMIYSPHTHTHTYTHMQWLDKGDYFLTWSM